MSFRDAGGGYVLHAINEIQAIGADGKQVTLKLSEGDYVISYAKNNKVGTGKMTLTLTQEAAKKYGIGGKVTYKFKIARQTSTGLKL